MNLQGHDRSYESQDRFSRKRNLKDLLHSQDDDSGYIEGKVFMIWPPRNRLHRINLQVVEDSTVYHFEVEVPHRDGIVFRPHERVSLALKGMKVDRRGESSAPRSFPIVLRFPNGIALKYLSGVNAGKIVDTWEGECIPSEPGYCKLMSVVEHTGNTDEWYIPGMGQAVSDVVTVDASEVHHGSAPTVTYPPMLDPPRRDVTTCHDEGIIAEQPPPSSNAVADGAATGQSVPPAQQLSTERPRRSKTRQRKRRKLQKEKESFHNQLVDKTSEPRPADVVTPCHEQSQTSVHGPLTNVSDSHSKLHQVCGHTDRGASIREDSGIGLSRKNNHGNVMNDPGEVGVPALLLKAGVRTQRVRHWIAMLLGVNFAF